MNTLMNLDRAYTLEKRSYDKSMRGILAMSSPPTGKVGVVRQLALDAEITSPRGYLKIAKDEDDLNSNNMFSPAELLTPMCATKDDSPRVAMLSTQSKHVIPCKAYTKPLVGNGMERALSHIISDDFCFKSKGDGKVVEIDDNLGLVTVEYKDGEKDIVDTSAKIAKNGGGGFYTVNKLDHELRLGQTFKKDDILAVNKSFFSQDGIYKSGAMLKIAIMSGYYNYEDSGIITEEACDILSTEVVMKRDVVLGKNSNIDFIVKLGDRVEVGDPLMVFDESYDDEGLNKMLASMNDDLKSQVQKLGKVPIKSKYSGIVEDIKIYSTVDLKELSPSMKKMFDSINKINKDRIKLINKHKNINDTNIIPHPIERINTPDGKIKGVDVGEGVLVEFYIKYKDVMGVGDKITFYTALKSVITTKVPKGLEPYSEFRQDETVHSFLSPISVLARMTFSIIEVGTINKVLMELKRKAKDIYDK